MSPLAPRFSSLSLVSSASNLKPRARRATACCSYLVHLCPHDQLPRECLSESRAEFLAIAAVVETGIRALRRVNQLCVPAIGAILLAPNLSHWLARWTYFVDHSVLSLALSSLCPNHDDLFLRYSNRLVTPGTEITAQIRNLDRQILRMPRTSLSFAEEPFPIVPCKRALQLRQRSWGSSLQRVVRRIQ